MWAKGERNVAVSEVRMSAAELRTRVCFNRRLSLAEGARIFVAIEDSNRRRLPRLAGNGLSRKSERGIKLTSTLLSVGGNINLVKALQEAKAWRFKSSQPGCQLRRAAEDSNGFYALPPQPNNPKRLKLGFLPAQWIQLQRLTAVIRITLVWKLRSILARKTD